MEKFGLLGEKLGHSYSKEIHEIFFELTGKKASYEMIEREIGEIEEEMESLMGLMLQFLINWKLLSILMKCRKLLKKLER